MHFEALNVRDVMEPFCHARYTSDEYYTYPNSYVFTKRIQTDNDEVELECL